ncbi:MAG TPA: histidine kinase [Candidatus Saccharimonadales bacterium]|nr:histidine kinase [Candidatus Saccharimonadales bacterium]
MAVGLSVLAGLMGPGNSVPEQSTPAVLLCTAPLLVRRRWPIPVLLLALGGFFIAQNSTNLAALAGGLIAAVGVGLDNRHPVLGAIAALGAALAISIEFGHGDLTVLPIPPFVAPFLMIGAAFLAGRAVASTRAQLAQQRERANQLEREHETAIKDATEGERRRIARELHDVIAHSVGVMVVQAGAARHIVAQKPEAAQESLLAVENSGHEAMAELRRLLGVLGENGEEPPLTPQPGVEKLDALVARLREAGLPVQLRIEGESRRLPPGVDIATYRIVQEALTNALKYAGGASTQAVVRFAPDAVDIDVVDEGTSEAPSDGIGRGLTGMRERVALFGGRIDAGRRAQGGYAVHAHLPVDAEA